ncbi:UPF0058 family protein [Halocatena marina]|uniref:UPF0058 family protein n=2 Tax=Halocatena marina TaxID=2934937 RepID=A0ABD5YR51_9EURY|nr:UPF0058 family protein [Halocatena marina]
MRKQDFIYLHGLLDRVCVVMQTRGDLSDEELTPYRTLDTSPTAVYHPKQEHEQAVKTLASILTEAIESDQSPPAHADSSRRIH